jgi:hypothetical protein
MPASGWSNSFATLAGRSGYQPTKGPRIELNRASPIASKARGGATAEAEAESVELAGFSALVVGLAVMPHVINTLVLSYGVIVSGNSFILGPYGLELISCTTTVGLTLWSIGSFIERGRGLPAGPLGLLGLSEGLAYLCFLFLALAGVVSTTRGGPVQVAVPAPTQISVPVAAPTPQVTVPSSLSAPISVPSVKAPEVKTAEVKKPEVKPPEVKKPEAAPAKAPVVKAPEVKKPEVKAPAAPAKPAASTPSYDSLFD